MHDRRPRWPHRCIGMSQSASGLRQSAIFRILNKASWLHVRGRRFTDEGPPLFGRFPMSRLFAYLLALRHLRENLAARNPVPRRIAVRQLNSSEVDRPTVVTVTGRRQPPLT